MDFYLGVSLVVKVCGPKATQLILVLTVLQASLVAQLVKNLPAMWEIWVQSLGWEDPLEKGKATTPVFWPGEFHGLYSPWCCKESDTTERLSLFPVLEHLYFFSIRLMIPSCACFPNAQKWLHGSLGGITGVTVVFTGIFTLVR